MTYAKIVTRGRTSRLSMQHPIVRPIARLREQNEFIESDDNM